MSVRIVLADDHPIVRNGVRACLGKDREMEIIAEARDGLDAVRVARQQRPDLVLMDVSMPGLNGIEATRRITAEQPGVKVLCLSMHANEKFVTAALDAGASGYLLKDRTVDELVDAVRTVMAGQTYFCRVVARAVQGARAAGADAVAAATHSPLTQREREVLQLIAEGLTNKDIAVRLHVSVKTVSAHRQNIMDKLGIHNVAGLTRYAIAQGLTFVEAGRPR